LIFLIRFWIFVPATPATYALFAGNLWVWSVSMPTPCVRSSLLLGRKFPRGHAGPPHLKYVETTEESTRCWSLLEWRHPATYAAQKAPSPSPRPMASSTTSLAPLCRKAGSPPQTFSPSTYGVVASRRVVDDAELNSPSEPEYVLLDKYICNKEVARIKAR
jgi:hypothetical protein